ncbi:uncharacterized protein [Lepeophtheirus salmonis]|uniref:uncharacterized protein n=1 Tax=Lepeophtheirus salmonis TaxID=72036 RepID=UPI001AE8BEF1|nr:uncharacterized protein LOC121116899 [Lepeophtheirus salmonis]
MDLRARQFPHSSYSSTSTRDHTDIPKDLWKRKWKRDTGEISRYCKDLISCKAPRVHYTFLPIIFAMGWILLYFIIDINRGIAIDKKLGESYLKEYYLNQLQREKLMELEEERNIGMPPNEFLNIIYAMPYLDTNPIMSAEYLKSIEKIVEHSTVPLKFNILTNDKSEKFVNTIMSRIREKSTIRIEHQILTLNEFYSKSKNTICPRLTDSKEFCELLITHLTPLLFPYVFKDIEKAIYLEHGLAFQDDIGMLYHTMKKLNISHEGIAAVFEQSSRYMRSFGTWQRINPTTKLGRPPSEARGKPGFNQALLVLDLSKLRNNREYRTFLNEKRIAKLINTYKFHGTVKTEHNIDFGDALNLLAVDAEYLFYTLDCSWNRRSDTSLDITDMKFNVCDIKSQTRAWNGVPNPDKIKSDRFKDNQHHSFVIRKLPSLEDI